MAACRESIIDNGNIYDEILIEQPASRTSKHNTRYDTFPTRVKAATCTKVYTKSLSHEPQESKENFKIGFSDMLAKTVHNVKQRVIRRTTENVTNVDSVPNARMERNLYRSRSTENILSDLAKSPTYKNSANAHCASNDCSIVIARGQEFHRPLPRLLNKPPLPVRKVKRDNQAYVNTALARATVSPMPVRKTAKQANHSGSVETLNILYETDKATNNKAPVYDKAYSDIDIGRNRGLKTQTISTEENQNHNRYQVTSESQIVGKFKRGDFEAAGKGVKVKTEIDKETVEEKGTTVKALTGSKAKHDIEVSDIRDMTITEIAGRLKELNLANYIELFKENQVDGVILANLKTDDLIQELGMKKLEAVRLKTFVESGHIPK